MKKKILPLALALALALVTIVPGPPPAAAGAANATSWADGEMRELLNRRILDVIPENPDKYITREAFCVMLAKASLNRAGAPLPAGELGNAGIFADAGSIKSENIPYIMYLYNQGILLGGSVVNGKQHMLPNALITRQEAAALLGRWLGLDLEGNTGSILPYADDGDMADYARSIIYQFSGMKIVSGYPDGNFEPFRNISYAESAVLLYRILVEGLLLTYFGDGNLGDVNGGAFTAKFAMPHGLCLDNSGNLIVFDTFNASVKRINRNRVDLLIGQVKAFDGYGFAMPYYLDGARANALLGRPVDGVCAPNGDLYIVDRTNHAIRLLRGGKVYTFAGGSQGFADGAESKAKFNAPSAITIDKSGNLYVADTMNHAIRKITADGTVSTLAGNPGKQGYADGAGSAALFCEPSGITIDSTGVIYVADTGNHVIRKISDGTVATIAGVAAAFNTGEDYRPGGYLDGPALSAQFNFPRGLHYADGVLFIADTRNHSVRALVKSGSVITVAGCGKSGDADGQAGAAMMNKPSSVAYSDGVLYIADSLNNKIKAIWLDPGMLT